MVEETKGRKADSELLEKILREEFEGGEDEKGQNAEIRLPLLDQSDCSSETDSFDSNEAEPGLESIDHYKLETQESDHRNAEIEISFVVSLWEFGVTIRKSNQILITGQLQRLILQALKLASPSLLKMAKCWL